MLFEDLETEGFKRELEALGFNVVAYANFPDLERNAGNLPKADIVITDNHLWYHDTDGMPVDREMVEWLPQWKKQAGNVNADTPVLFITDSSQTTYRTLQAIDNGFNGFLWKSQRISDLEKGMFLSKPAQEVLHAVLENPQADKLYVTPFWKEVSLKDFSTFEPVDMTTHEIEEMHYDGKTTVVDQRKLHAALVTPEEMGVHCTPWTGSIESSGPDIGGKRIFKIY